MDSRAQSKRSAAVARPVKILLIAPRNEQLPLALADAEVQEILRSGGIVTPVLGNVDSSDFLHHVAANGHEVLMLITHGGDQGILLSDGWLPAPMVVSTLRDCFELVFLNTCSSLGMAQMLQNESGCGVISTVSDVEDKQAFFTGAQFARELVRGNDYYEAYKRSRPGANTTYVYLAGRAKEITGMQEFQDLVAQIADLQRTMVEFKAAIDHKVAIIADRADTRTTGSISLNREQALLLIGVLCMIALILAIGFWYLGNGGR